MNNRRNAVVPFVLLWFFVAVADAAEKKVFLFAGQSNMAGADAVIADTGAKNLIGAGLQTEADQNTRFAYGCAFDPANTQSYAWGDVRGHLGVKRSAPGYYVHGPEVGFERTLYASGIRDIVIIQVANNFSVPCTGPWPWMNKDPASTSPDFYTHWSAYVNARLAELTSNGDTYTIAGFVWWQGIDDAFNHTTEAQYKANLTTLISQLRADFGTPTTPFVLAREKSDVTSMAAALAPIRAAQVSVADADRYANWVDIDDQTNVNMYHFSSASQLVVGQRLGDAYLALAVPEASATAMLFTAGLTICLLAGLGVCWRRWRGGSCGGRILLAMSRCVAHAKGLSTKVSIILVAYVALTQCAPIARGADPSPQTVRPVNTSGIVEAATRSRPALAAPDDDAKGHTLKYGLGQIFQVAPRTAAVSCNVRTIGTGHWDFENGTDVIVFNNIATIGRQKPFVVARNEEDQNPTTGKKRIAVTYPIQIGFVPLGAKRLDGSTHPDAGTGFGLSQALCYDLNDQGYYTPADAKAGGQAPSTKRWYVHQFAYDGREFHVVKRETKSADVPLKTADGAWSITAPGLSAATADGGDLLLPVSASDGKRTIAGVSRWGRTNGDWCPVTFYAVSEGMEPSLIRDVDGSLLYSVRGNGKEEGQAVRVWRSCDGAKSWQLVLHLPTLRSNAPVVLNQAADGTPYIAANQPRSFRAKLCLWPLNAERSGCGPAVMTRDCEGDFGPAPKGTTWFADHPMATTVQLSDGQWHNLLGYRVIAFSTAGVGEETLTPHTGCYIEQVNSSGPTRPSWPF